MIVKEIIAEDFIQYKKPSMFILMPRCSFKCEKDCGISGICQNSNLVKLPNISIPIDTIIHLYEENKITKSVVFGGMEPFDSFDDVLNFIIGFRCVCNDDIVIYTGYKEEEICDKIKILMQYKNIIIKFGRFIPNQESHLDEILGVRLASPNQYARKIS